MRKFYDREKEKKVLMEVRSKKLKIAIVGRRRIGKTTLVREVLPNAVFLFVPQNKSEKIIINEWSEEYEFIPKMESLREVFKYLFKQYNDKIYFIDEFQNLIKVNKAILSDLQYLIDKYEPALIITGSLVSMMRQIIEDYKSPLYGRFDYIIKLKELDPLTSLKWGYDLKLDINHTVRLWSIIGGIPKYWELFEKTEKKDVDKYVEEYFIFYPRPLYEEINIMLKEEFGKEHKIYFSILEAISQGRNTIGEISNYTGIKPTNLTKYLYILRYDHEIIKRITSFGGKRGIYAFKSNIFDFWFRYLYRYQYLLEEEKEKTLVNKFKETFNSYVGRKFEEFIKDYLMKTHPDYNWHNWWHKDKEIDLLAVNEQTKELLAVEVKWQNLRLRDVKNIIEELHEKLPYVQWHNEKRKESLGIFAKKVDKKARDWLVSEGYKVWDLEDVERLVRIKKEN